MKFTQFLLPNGQPRPMMVDRPPDIEAKAAAVVEAGGRFETEILTTGIVSFTVEHDLWEAEDRGAVAHELAANGPPVLVAVDTLVEKAHRALCVVPS